MNPKSSPILKLSLLIGICSMPACSCIERGIEKNYRPPAVMAYETPAGRSKGAGSNQMDGAKLIRNKAGQIDINSEGFENAYGAAKKDRGARDFLITQLMLASDELVEQHKALIVGNYATHNAVLSILTSATGGLAAVFTPPGTKSALGASSAIINSSRSTVNEQFYQNQFSSAITRAIDTQRAAVRLRIEAGLAKDIGEYPVDTALRDLQDYHNAGSFASGLNKLAEAIENQKETFEQLGDRIDKMTKQRDEILSRSKNSDDSAQKITDQADAQALTNSIHLLLQQRAFAPAQ